MAGFLSDLLACLPVPDDEDFDAKIVFKGVREALKRLNEELEFVQGLRVVREKIDAIEKIIAENASLGSMIQEQQMKANEKIADTALTIEGQASKIQTMEDSLEGAEKAASSASYRSDGGKDPLAGHPKHLPKWASTSHPFSQWKHVFETGLDCIKPGLKSLLKFIEETPTEEV